MSLPERRSVLAHCATCNCSAVVFVGDGDHIIGGGEGCCSCCAFRLAALPRREVDGGLLESDLATEAFELLRFLLLVLAARVTSV